jgi:hypothetical protein
LIYIRGLKAKDLTAIVDFIHLGEVNIFQEVFLIPSSQLLMSFS